MSEDFNNDSFEPEAGDTTYRSHNIQDESNIFEKEAEVNYEPPVEQPSIFEQPMYRQTAYDKPTEEQPVQSDQQVQKEVVSQQPQYNAYRFSSQDENKENVSEEDTASAGISEETMKAESGQTETVKAETEETENSQGQTTNTYQTDTSAAGKTTQTRKPVQSAKKAKDKKKGGFGKKLAACVALAVVFGLVSGGVFLGIAKVGSNALGLNQSQAPSIGMVGSNGNQNTTNEGGGSGEATTVSSENYTVAQVAERCMPAMVGITNKSIQEVPSYFGFGSQNYESESSGSGIIIGQTDTELLIATNNHVVSGANTLTVCFVDDELVNAIIKGTDAENDLAVISVQLSNIKEETLNQIKIIEIGDSESLQVGEQVVAIGNALGYGQSVSSGWVSALNREVTIENTTLTLIQTDAAINPGNSGGALLNMKGELIGINESKYADTAVEGMGYAIPISTATPILSDLMARETRYKVDEADASYIGISCKDISSDFAEMYNVPTGVYVDSVVDGGPAATAGLQKGDIITKFDGVVTASYSDLISLLEYYASGEIVEVTYYRTNNGQYTEQTASLVLGARSNSELANQESETESSQNSEGSQNGGNSEYYGSQDGGFDIFDFFGY